VTGAHANRLGPVFEPAPLTTTLPDVMTPAETELVYRAGPPPPAAPAEPGDPVVELLQRLAVMRGFNKQVKRALVWLIVNADDLPVPFAEDEPAELAAKTEARAPVCAQALGYLRPGAQPPEPPRPRRRSGRGGRGRRARPAAEPAAAG
jgi:hypothetical protein